MIQKTDNNVGAITALRDNITLPHCGRMEITMKKIAILILAVIFCGLLPEELESRCEVVHNSSLHGTVRFACEQNDLTAFTKKARYVDLANNADFSKMFIDNMMFSEV